MYTILINDDKSLTTSVKSTLLRNSTTDEIWVLLKPTSPVQDTSEDPEANPQITVESEYTAVLHYETNHILKSFDLTTDEELYKDRVRFRVPSASTFFSNRGMMQLWFDVSAKYTVTTITTVIDPETGEETEETATEIINRNYTTLTTSLFIEEVPIEKNFPWHKDDNSIRITRGDSLTINVSLTDNDGYPYVPIEGDEVWFTVKKRAIAEDVLIRKSIDIETLALELEESDTENLAFGEYKYEIEVITTENGHYTVIKNAPFIIMEELH